jgi:hypothetical protein
VGQHGHRTRLVIARAPGIFIANANGAGANCAWVDADRNGQSGEDDPARGQLVLFERLYNIPAHQA